MTTMASPCAWSSPAVSAISLPKLRDRLSSATCGSACCRAWRAASVPSVLPSLTKMISQPVPSRAITVLARRWNSARPAASLKQGTTTETSVATRRGAMKFMSKSSNVSACQDTVGHPSGPALTPPDPVAARPGAHDVADFTHTYAHGRPQVRLACRRDTAPSCIGGAATRRASLHVRRARSVRPAQRPCWIAESTQRPPGERRKVQSSVAWVRVVSLPATRRPLPS